jgi:hypothetical protein
MLDRMKGLPPLPGKRVTTFLMPRHQYRPVALKRERLKDSPEVQFQVKHIQEKLNCGTARIKGR